MRDDSRVAARAHPEDADEEGEGGGPAPAVCDDERRQIEADKRYWQKRLEELGKELDTEPARIRQSYDVKATRFEPVGLVYLWPVTG